MTETIHAEIAERPPVPARKKPIPRTAEDLRAEVARLESTLVDGQRARDASRMSLPALIAQGNDEAIAECRKNITLAEAKIREVVETLEQTREAIREAQARDRAASDAQAYRVIKRLVGDTRKEVEVLAETIKAFASALKAASAGLDSVDAQMRRSGVIPDPYVLKAKLIGIVELALHIETGGLVCVARTLENHHELRQSGRASLLKAANEFQTLTMQRVRSALQVTREPE